MLIPGWVQTSPALESSGNTLDDLVRFHLALSLPYPHYSAACLRIVEFHVPICMAHSVPHESCCRRHAVFWNWESIWITLTNGKIRRNCQMVLRGTNLSILIRLSNSFKCGSDSLSHIAIILLSMSVANIWLSKNRLKNGRWCCCWSDKNEALSKFCRDSRLVSHSFLSWLGRMTKFSYEANICTKRFKKISRTELFKRKSSQYRSCCDNGPRRLVGITSLLQSISSVAMPLRRIMFNGGFCAETDTGASNGCVCPSNTFGDDGRSQSNVSCNDILRLAWCNPDGNVQLDVITSSERCKNVKTKEIQFVWQ